MAMQCSKAVTLILCLFISISIALAGAGGNGKGKGKGKQSAAESEVAAARAGVGLFVGKDREIIRSHFRSPQGKLPPGLAKREDLPPGLAKQLKRNKALPPGLEKKLSAFPVELEKKLPPLKEGLKRWIIGGNAVILDGKTSIILDIFKFL
jgi:hypothetical protein